MTGVKKHYGEDQLLLEYFQHKTKYTAYKDRTRRVMVEVSLV